MSQTRPAGRVIFAGARATAAGFVVRFGARIGFLYLAAHLFGIILFGAYSLAVAGVELAVTVAGLGAKRLIFKQLEEAGERPPIHIVWDAALLVTAAGLLLGALFVLAAAVLPLSVLTPNTARALMLLAPMIAGQALLDLFCAATRWTHVIRYEVTARSIIEPYGALAFTLAAWALGWRESGLLIGYIAGTLAALGYAVIGLRRCYGRFRLGAWHLAAARLPGLLRDASAATFNDFLNGLFGRVDLYLVGIFLGEAPAGIYNMARQIRTPVRQVRQSFDGLLNPVIARTLSARGARDTGAATAAAARLILAVQLPILIALAFAGVPLLASFGHAFTAGYWALLLLGAAEMIQGAFGVSDLILLYRRPAAQNLVTLTNIATNIVAGLILIGPLGVTGAALAVLVGVVLGALVRRLSLRTHFDVRTPLHYSAPPDAAAALGVAAAFAAEALLAAAPLWVHTAAGLAAGLATCAVLLRLWLHFTGESLSLGEFES
jgi:O-antigen/teichoic acid export membrane protein